MIERSKRAEVKNPVLALPAFQRLRHLSPEAKAALRDVLGDLAEFGRAQAQHCWRTNKGPMALYWKVVGVYAGHIRRAIGRAENG